MHAIDESFFVEVDQQPETKIMKHRGTEDTETPRRINCVCAVRFKDFPTFRLSDFLESTATLLGTHCPKEASYQHRRSINDRPTICPRGTRTSAYCQCSTTCFLDKNRLISWLGLRPKAALGSSILCRCNSSGTADRLIAAEGCSVLSVPLPLLSVPLHFPATASDFP